MLSFSCIRKKGNPFHVLILIIQKKSAFWAPTLDFDGNFTPPNFSTYTIYTNMMHTSQPIITTTPFDDTYHFALSYRQNDSFLAFSCTVEAIYAVFPIRCRFFEHPYVHLVCWICGFMWFYLFLSSVFYGNVD